MSADETPKAPTPDAATADPIERSPALDAAQESMPGAAALHTDELWGGPRFIENAQHQPVWCETKEQYWALLRANGVRMKDQQESTTGPGPDPELDTRPHVETLPPIVVRPLVKDEAHLVGAMTAIYRRYGLREAVFCADCFARERPHGCRMIVSDRRIEIQCRCGVAAYAAPTGTTDLVLRSLANMTHTENDKTIGTIMAANGLPEFRPVRLLHDGEAYIISEYFRLMTRRHKEPRLFHSGCAAGDPRHDDNPTALGVSINASEIVLVCRCQQLFWRAKKQPVSPSSYVH